MRIAAILLAAALAAAALYLLQRHEGGPPVREAAPAPSRVAAEGRVEAEPGFDVDVSSGELNGRVAKILVREGEAVREGQLVAVLDNADLQARVAAAARELAVAESRLAEVLAGARREEILQAAAALEGARASRAEAEKQVRRHRELLAQGMISPAALDAQERAFEVAGARVEELEQHRRLLEAGPRGETVKLHRDQVALARAGLEVQRRALDRTLIRSPIAGTVIKRYLDEGEGVTPEIPLLAVADLGRLWINAEVDETDAGKVRVGDSAEVTFEAYPGAVYRGRVSQVAQYAGQRAVRPRNPAVNLGLKVVQVKIALEDRTPLKLGMTVDVRIFPAGR
jgi:HlyD family secretion protein